MIFRFPFPDICRNHTAGPAAVLFLLISQIGYLRNCRCLHRRFPLRSGILSAYVIPVPFLIFRLQIAEIIQGDISGDHVSAIVSDYDMNNPEEKTAFMKAAGQLLAGIEDSTERSNYIDSVAAKYMLSRDELKKIVSKAGMAAVTIESIPRETPVYQKEQDSPAEKNQKYLLTMMVNEPFLFDKLSDVISQEDFTEPVICEVAEMVFGQYRDSGQVNPAQILNQFEDTEAQEKVSGIFTKELDFDTTPSVLEKALTDLIIKIKSDNIDKIRKTRTDVSSIELAKKKADLKKLRVRI